MSLSTLFTRAWNTAGALVRPNGITRYLKCPRWVLKAVLHSSPSRICSDRRSLNLILKRLQHHKGDQKWSPWVVIDICPNSNVILSLLSAKKKTCSHWKRGWMNEPEIQLCTSQWLVSHGRGAPGSKSMAQSYGWYRGRDCALFLRKACLRSWCPRGMLLRLITSSGSGWVETPVGIAERRKWAWQ